jgi:hypothetical protein
MISSQQSQEYQVDELKAGVELYLAVLARPPALVQPGKTVLDQSALEDYCKFVRLAALGDLHRYLLPKAFPTACAKDGLA